jgi:hypothetical protein
MNNPIYESRFSSEFSKILEQGKVSCYAIANYADIDQAYISRLKNGYKGNPSPEVLIKICLALAHLNSKIKISDIETLFNATGRTLFYRK